MKYAELNRLTNIIERLEIYATACGREISKPDTDYDKWEAYQNDVDQAKQDLLNLFDGKDN